MSNWTKTTPYGDYKDTADRTLNRDTAQTHIIRKAQALRCAGKHAGSKPVSRLVQGIRNTEITSQIILKMEKVAQEKYAAQHKDEVEEIK